MKHTRNRLTHFWTKSKTRGILEGKALAMVAVNSGVPQDRHLCPSLFLCHINLTCWTLWSQQYAFFFCTGWPPKQQNSVSMTTSPLKSHLRQLKEWAKKRKVKVKQYLRIHGSLRPAMQATKGSELPITRVASANQNVINNILCKHSEKWVPWLARKLKTWQQSKKLHTKHSK